MVETQEGACFLCKSPPGKRKLSVDHIHEGPNVGKVRALLCHPCNAALGLFKDDSSLLRKAADYIDEHNKEEQ